MLLNHCFKLFEIDSGSHHDRQIQKGLSQGPKSSLQGRDAGDGREGAAPPREGRSAEEERQGHARRLKFSQVYNSRFFCTKIQKGFVYQGIAGGLLYPLRDRGPAATRPGAVWPGAYDANGDSFPIMDVNSNRAPWVRVKSGDPVRAMRTFDTVANRLYLPVSEAGSETDGSGRYGRRLRAAPGDADRPSIGKLLDYLTFSASIPIFRVSEGKRKWRANSPTNRAAKA